MKQQIELSIIVPVYNEEQTLTEFMNRIESVRDKLTNRSEIVFVNDGSKDNSTSILHLFSQRHNDIRVICLSRNFGHQTALIAGIHYAQGRSIVFIDSDLQDPPELIIDMYHRLKEGYDIVAAQRKKRTGEGIFKIYSANLFYTFLRSISKIDIPPNIGDFQMLGAKPLNAIKSIKGNNLYLRGIIPWMGFKRFIIPYIRSPRFAGKTHYTFGKMFNLALNAVTSLSDLPLRVCTIVGLWIVLISFLYLLRVLFLRLVMNITVPGWSSLISIILFLGGIQLIFLGIIGEYIANIYHFVNEKPPYLVSDEFHSENYNLKGKTNDDSLA